MITSFTSICRLRPQLPLRDARRIVTDLPEDVHSPFAASPRTHFGRILVIDSLMVHERLPLGRPVLLVSADFDGDDVETYLLELLGDPSSGGHLAAVLALCEDGPCDPSEPSFAIEATRFLVDRRIPIGLQYVNDARHRSAQEVRRAVARHRRLVGFAKAHQGEPPGVVREAFIRTFRGRTASTR